MLSLLLRFVWNHILKKALSENQIVFNYRASRYQRVWENGNFLRYASCQVYRFLFAKWLHRLQAEGGDVISGVWWNELDTIFLKPFSWNRKITRSLKRIWKIFCKYSLILWSMANWMAMEEATTKYINWTLWMKQQEA